MKRKFFSFTFVLALFAALVLPCVAQQTTGSRPNLLANPSFEEGDAGWQFSSWNSKGTATVDTDEKRDGKASIRIENAAGDDSFLKKTVKVKPKTRYRLTAYIKTKDVDSKGPAATVALQGGFEKSDSISGRKNWTRVTLEFETGLLEEVTIGPRLGHHGSLAVGTAWFDDLSLVEMGPSRR